MTKLEKAKGVSGSSKLEKKKFEEEKNVTYINEFLPNPKHDLNAHFKVVNSTRLTRVTKDNNW